ncbi:hypothetical protein [Jeotgalibacillus terrae]|uniref:Uncharacterized protein n=1 Tax=Jeotgalibacillus terrae TaxID=587735 RepID=A0ABW5ZD21_9BACL|nr:hypothetical protein [Jeotgalibacillus terrae]MBM7580512.1 hypothetical protein [Jeotgalibacillus terrae]
MQFSIEEPYWKNKAEQLMIQLGFSESERERVSGKLFTDQPESESDCMQIILNEASHIQPEIETISPHADDQEIHEALQELPFAQKSAVVLTVFHPSAQLQKMISADDYQEGLSRLSGHLDTDQSQTEKLLRFLKPTYDHIEMPEARESLNQEEETPEPLPTKKQKAVKPIASAVLVIGLLSGAMFLLGDPPVADDGQGAQEAEEDDEPENEKAFTDEEIEDLEASLNEKKEQLAETLGLKVDDLNFLAVIQQADSHFKYIKGMMKQDVGTAGPGIEDMKQYTGYLLDSLNPPLTVLRNSYEQSEEMYPDNENELLKSDMAVSMFMDTANDFTLAYELKLEELIRENNYSEADLRQNNSELFEKISSNGMEVKVNQSGEQLDTTVYYGGPELKAQTDYLHPEYQQFISSLHEIGLRMYVNREEYKDSLTEMADQLLNIEKLMMNFFSLQDSLNEDEGMETYQFGHELQVPRRINYQYTDLMKSIISDHSMSVGAGIDISDNYRDVWQYILNNEKFNDSNIKKVVSLNQWIAEKNQYERIAGFGDVSISLFRDYIDPLSNFNHSSASVSTPLSGYMEEIYQIYATEGYERIDFINPQILIVFYLNALETGDYETAYSLLGGENLPDYESFVQAASQYEYEFGYINDVVPVSSSNDGMVFTFNQSRNSVNFTITESEDWYHIRYNSADIFEALASEVGG